MVLLMLIILIIAYTLKGRRLEKPEEKFLMYGFMCFFAGFIVLFIYLSFLAYLFIPGYYEDHTYFGNVDFMVTNLYALILKIVYVSTAIGTTLLILACEYYLKRTKYGNIYSVSQQHREKNNIFCDPKMSFFRDLRGNFYPLSYMQDNLEIYKKPVVFKDEDITAFPGLQLKIIDFVKTWMENIEMQQGLHIGPEIWVE